MANIEEKKMENPQWMKPGVVAYNPNGDCCGLLVNCRDAEGGIAIFRAHGLKSGRRLEGDNAIPYDGWIEANEEQCERYWEMFSESAYRDAQREGSVWDTKRGGGDE